MRYFRCAKLSVQKPGIYFLYFRETNLNLAY
jgi:hypothetical protein